MLCFGQVDREGSWGGVATGVRCVGLYGSRQNWPVMLAKNNGEMHWYETLAHRVLVESVPCSCSEPQGLSDRNAEKPGPHFV